MHRHFAAVPNALDARALGYVGQARLISTVSRATAQDKATVAIATINVTVLVNFEVNARMAKRRWREFGPAANIAGPVTADAGVVDEDGFWWRDAHGVGG